MRLVSSLIALAALLLGPSAVRAADLGAVVVTHAGSVQGLRQADGTTVFRGIPFAEPPVASLRWRPPQAPHPWADVRIATARAPSCTQTAYGGWNADDAARGREDCLYLDVRSPTLGHGARLPVMVWIHGGGNRGGSMGDTVMSSLGGRGVVLVAIQYRLAALGFMSHPALTAETPDKTSGNYGLMDQIAALQWVHDNIARFGGDPSNVTLAGQSAGAQDVSLLMLAPGARGLFQKAIEESGTADFGVPSRTLAKAERVGETVAALAGAPFHASATQLRALSADALIAAGDRAQVAGLDDPSFIWLQTTVDGRVLKRPPSDVLSAGEQLHIPLLIGSNARELDLHGDGVRAAVIRLYGPNATTALRLYGLEGDMPPQTDPRLGDVATQLADDVTFRCPSGEVAQAQARTGAPVWRYQYDVAPPTGRVAHSAELRSVFDARPVTPPGVSPSFSLQDYWLAFAQTGDPNRPGLTPWPRFSLAGQAYLAFDPQGPEAKSHLRAPFCSFLSSF